MIKTVYRLTEPCLHVHQSCLLSLPHDLCVAHGLVDAGEGAHGLLHHLLAHAEHVVLLKELIGQLCHTQARVNLLRSHKHT